MQNCPQFRAVKVECKAEAWLHGSKARAQAQLPKIQDSEGTSNLADWVLKCWAAGLQFWESLWLGTGLVPEPVLEESPMGMKGLHLGVVVLKGYSGRKLGRSLWRWPFHGMVLWFYYLQHHWKGVKAHASHGSNIAPLVIIRMETPWVMDVWGKRETNRQGTLMAGNLFYWLALLGTLGEFCI